MPFLRNSLLEIAGFIVAATSVFLIHGHNLRGQAFPSFRLEGYDANYLNRDLPGGPISPPPFVGIPQRRTASQVPSAPAPLFSTAPIQDTSERVEELSARYGTDPDSLLSALEKTQTVLQNSGYQSFQDIPQILVDLDDTHHALDALRAEHAEATVEQQRLSEENRLFQSQAPHTGLGRALQHIGDTISRFLWGLF